MKVRPVLIPQEKATWPNCIWLGRISKQLRLDHSYDDSPRSIDPIDYSMLPQQLILISLEDEKIEVGDKYYDEHNSLILTATTQSDHDTYHYKKVIATQSQLSPEYINQFIEEYNRGKVKDVEIEEEEITEPVQDGNWSKYIIYHPKLTNGFVTIVKELPVINFKDATLQDMYDRGYPKVKQPITYTEEEVKELMKKFVKEEYDDIWYSTNDDWFNKNKKI